MASETNPTMVLLKDDLVLGFCVGTDRGYWFNPMTTSHRSSRKMWESACKCIPKWAFDMSTDMLTRDEWKAQK